MRRKIFSRTPKNRRGFTLVETMVTLSVIGVVAAGSVGAYQTLRSSTDLKIAAATLAEALYQAEARAQAVAGDSPWGVRVDPAALTIFRGSAYASRAAEDDIILSVPSRIAIAGAAEVDFKKFTGLPERATAFTLTGRRQASRAVAVSALGVVSY